MKHKAISSVDGSRHANMRRSGATCKPVPTENQIAQQICDYLRYRGWRVHRLEADISGPKAKAKREDAGTPDYIAVRRREWQATGCDCVYIEVKRPGGKLRRTQELWIWQSRDEGWDVIVASSIDDLVAEGL